jgi:CheY-like chemotaxis protein
LKRTKTQQRELKKLQSALTKNRELVLEGRALTSDLEQAQAASKDKKAEARKNRIEPREALEPPGCPDLTKDADRLAYLGTILLIEDNADDVFLVGKAFSTVGITNPLRVVPDGQQAVRYLRGEDQYADRTQFPIPRLILLDLDLPLMTGLEVLSWLRVQPDLRHLPVIVLTTSTYSPDVRQAYQLGANSFLIKPTDFTDLISEVKEMGEFWLRGMNR